ncbi:MAG: threonylcarbamoyl-AMP synthase [Gammaproteobacteria bacterium]|nr:threonylcarbamoyl-AMP synthase [Gammaproteobacteria bacterium]
MQYLQIHPVNPQPRLISQAVAIVRNGGVIVYPTDSCYALGCQIGDKAAMERIQRLRKLDPTHNFTLVCRDLSDLATYARVGNPEFRLLKSLTPGPYTFILTASHEVPRRLQNPKRKTIGLRIPDQPIARALLEALDEPLMSVTLILPDSPLPLSDPEEIREQLEKQVDAIIDGGSCGNEPTSIIDLTGEVPRVVRQGKGDTSFLTA